MNDNYITCYCVLGDCNTAWCHHCFPVKDCKEKHPICIKEGACEDYNIKYNEYYKNHDNLYDLEDDDNDDNDDNDNGDNENDVNDDDNKIIVTGCAGFIGSHLCEKLCKIGYNVIGIDNINDYYDVNVKIANLNHLKKYEKFLFLKEDICDTQSIEKYKPISVIHLASMAGVRNSIENPEIYEKVNCGGFLNILQQCVKNNISKIIYASSSSVYGLNEKVPFEETDLISKCNSPYAVSKYCMEMYAKTYNQLYNLKTIGFRFFTVYGPRGRPDMAPYKFLYNIKNGIPIDKYGDGSSSRDYTYVDDIVNGIISALQNDEINCEVYNLGNSSPVTLNTFIEICEKVCNKEAIINNKPNQLGDVPKTYACIDKAKRDLNYNPTTDLFTGLTNAFNSL